MKKVALYAVGSLFLLLLFSLCAAAWWLLDTGEGARRILSFAASEAGARLSIGRLRGSINDGLTLEETDIRAHDLSIRIRSLRLDIRPLLLLTGEIAVERLHLSGVTIRDQRPESKEPFDLGWPTITGIPARLNGRISSLSVRNLDYRRLSRDPLVLSALSARLDWRDGTVSAGDLTVVSPDAKVTGRAAVGLTSPRLNLSLTAAPTRPAAGFSAFFLNARLAPGRGREQAAGEFRAAARSSGKRMLQLAGRIATTRTSLTLRDMALSESGRKGKVSGSGVLSFAAPLPTASLRLRLEGLDLSPEVPSLPPVTGSFDLGGSAERYQGNLHLIAAGKGWRSAVINGALSGTSRAALLRLDRSSWLGGTLWGSLRAGWEQGVSLAGEFRGRNLNPARITPDWKGVINLDMKGSLEKRAGSPVRGTISSTLLESTLRGRRLTGDLAARFRGESFLLDRLLFRGKGFDISASGDLGRAIAFSVAASDLSGLIPGTAGSLRAAGEVRRRGGRVGVTASGSAGSLRIESLRVKSASFAAEVGDAPDRPLRLRFDGRGLGYDGFQASEAAASLTGTMAKHEIVLSFRSSAATLEAALDGAWRAAAWEGRINRLAGRDGVGPWNLERPAGLKLSSTLVGLSPLVLSGSAGERLEIRGEVNRKAPESSLEARWQRINLARIGQWLSGVRLSGAVSGSLSLAAPRVGPARIAAVADLAGKIVADGRQLEVRAADVRIETVGRNLRATATADMGDKGRLRLESAAPLPGHGLVPDRGRFDARLGALDLTVLRPWLPADLSLEGGIEARASGEWLPGGKVQLDGDAAVTRGLVRHRRKEGELNAALRTASLAWKWRDDSLNGRIDLDLSDRGRVTADFRLPLPARVPVSLNRTGTVSLALEGKVHESGLLAALFPGMAQETRGELDADLRAAGTWSDPRFSGRILLSGGGAYLPRAGIRLTDIRAAASLEKNGIRIDSFTARSGPGTLGGSGSLLLKEWKITEYRGSIRGDRFQLMHLPEMQLLGSPRLELSGTVDKITVRGELDIPELLVAGRQTPAPVKRSSDVVVVDAPREQSRPFPLAVDLQVRVLFGDRVFVKAEGIDARLTGGVDLTMRGLDKIRGRGEVRVAEGSYRAYGANLKIVKGRLVFTGGPVDRPTLDILALRTVGEVKAGVILGGTLQSPVIRLYSEPAMTDGDIMGYIVLGRPLSGDKGQMAAVMQAAGLLLSAGQSAVLQEQIGKRFGLDTFGMEPDRKDVTQSLVTIGKYLTPRLFLSYGRSLFSPTTYIRARYTFSERWELETWTGTESGVDVYYKINFD